MDTDVSLEGRYHFFGRYIKALASQGTSGCLPLLAYPWTFQSPLVEDTAAESAWGPCGGFFTSLFQGLFANPWVPRVRLHSQKWTSMVMMASHLSILVWWLLLWKPLWVLRTEQKRQCKLHDHKVALWFLLLNPPGCGCYLWIGF